MYEGTEYKYLYYGPIKLELHRWPWRRTYQFDPRDEKTYGMDMSRSFKTIEGAEKYARARITAYLETLQLKKDIVAEALDNDDPFTKPLPSEEITKDVWLKLGGR